MHFFAVCAKKIHHIFQPQNAHSRNPAPAHTVRYYGSMYKKRKPSRKKNTVVRPVHITSLTMPRRGHSPLHYAAGEWVMCVLLQCGRLTASVTERLPDDVVEYESWLMIGENLKSRHCSFYIMPMVFLNYHSHHFILFKIELFNYLYSFICLFINILIWFYL